MNWQDIIIGISNIGFIIALFPLILSLFGLKTIELGIVLTGLIYGSFLILAAVGIIGLGAYFGGIATAAAGIIWFTIAILATFKGKTTKF